MSENYRKERIERLLDELRYEVTRGMMEQEIDEFLQFTWIVPVSQRYPNGTVRCEFRTEPRSWVEPELHEPKLRVVK